MNSIHIDFEDAHHLQSQLAYLHERLCVPAQPRGIASIAMFDDEELRSELARRGAAEAQSQPEKPAPKSRRPRAEAPAAQRDPADTQTQELPLPEPNEPEPTEPEPQKEALPDKPTPVDTKSDTLVPVIPEQDDLQMVMGYIVAVNGAAGVKTVKDIMARIANAKSLKTASVATWPDLMQAMLKTLGLNLDETREAHKALMGKEELA